MGGTRSSQLPAEDTCKQETPKLKIKRATSTSLGEGCSWYTCVEVQEMGKVKLRESQNKDV